MSSYIGYTPRFLTDTTNQLSDQVIAIVLDQNDYTLSFAPTSDNLLMVSVNGTLYVPTLDYFITGNIITFTKLTFPDSGNIYIYYLGANYFRINSVSDGAIQHNHLASELKTFNFQKFIGDGTTTEFTLNFYPGSSYAIFVTLDSVLLEPVTDYSVVSNVLTINVAPILTAELNVRNLGFKTSFTDYILASGSVTTDKISNLAVQTAKIDNLAVTDAKIANQTISFGKLSTSLTSDIFFFSKINSNTSLDNTKSSKLLVDTSANSVVITLPANPTLGQNIEIVDYNNSFDEFSLTILRNGKTIDTLSENSIFYKKGVHCNLVYKGNDDWKTLFYDAGLEFTGVQYILEGTIEAFNTLASRHVSSIAYGKSKYTFSVSPSSNSLTTGQTLSITITSNTNSIVVSGSGAEPKLVLLLSTAVTKDATLTSSTNSTLVFQYTVEAATLTTGLTIQSFNPGDKTVTCNSFNFSCVLVSLNVNFV